MRYIMKKEPVIECDCGACMQVEDRDVVADMYFDTKMLDTVIHKYVRCPNCRKEIYLDQK